MFSTIGQIAITVTDIHRSVAFYRDVLGFEYLFSAGRNLTFLKVGEVRLMLTHPEGASTPGSGMVLYLRTSNLDDGYASILSRGAEGVDPPHLIAEMPDHDLWMAFIKDPDGYLIGLMEERPK